jgi:hypothetical protein
MPSAIQARYMTPTSRKGDISRIERKWKKQSLLSKSHKSPAKYILVALGLALFVALTISISTELRQLISELPF